MYIPPLPSNKIVGRGVGAAAHRQTVDSLLLIQENVLLIKLFSRDIPAHYVDIKFHNAYSSSLFVQYKVLF